MKLADDIYLPKVLASVIVIVLSIGLFVFFTARNGTPLGIYDSGIGDHWPTNHRDLTVVDETSDPNWHQAIVAAMATWTAGGSALHLTIASGNGACTQQRDHIEYCQATTPQISTQGSDGDQGLFVPKVGKSHDYKSAVVLVCSDCDVDQTRMVVIATHELGHALGLAHSADPQSVMYYLGGSTRPDAVDYQILRQREGAAAAAGG